MSISAVKTLQADPSSHTWTALENLIKLAAAADIPLVGGAFGVASEVIGAFSVCQVPRGGALYADEWLAHRVQTRRKCLAVFSFNA